MKMARLVFPVFVFLFSAFSFVFAAPPMSDEKLTVSPGIIAELKQLKPALVFKQDDATMYTGIGDPLERARADADFAMLIDVLIQQLPQHPYQSFVEQQIRRTYAPFRLADTEDRERAIDYCEKILKVVGAKNYGGFLNILLYGPILGRGVNQ